MTNFNSYTYFDTISFLSFQSILCVQQVIIVHTNKQTYTQPNMPYNIL